MSDTNNQTLSPGDPIPIIVESMETLIWLGLNEKRAQQVWKQWSENQEKGLTDDDYDFGGFAREFLMHAVEWEACDTEDADVDWSPYLEKIGAHRELREGIARADEKHDSVRLTQSAWEWVDLALDWRWEWLKQASQQRVKGGISDLSSLPGSTRPIQGMAAGQGDVKRERYDVDSKITSGAQGKLDYLPLWRATSRIKAEKMWLQDYRPPGEFNLANQRYRSPTDFSLTGAQSWTPDLEVAEMYADWTTQFVGIAQVCLLRFDVPQKVLEQQSTYNLRYPSEDFRRTVFCSRRGQQIKPKDLQRRVVNASLLVGDIATGNRGVYQKMKGWEEVDERCLLYKKNGEPATQYVFSHTNDRDLQELLNEYGSKVSVRCFTSPDLVLPPMGVSAELSM